MKIPIIVHVYFLEDASKMSISCLDTTKFVNQHLVSRYIFDCLTRYV